MESDIDNVALLKSVKDLKKRIDDLTDKNLGAIDILEIKCIRTVVDNFLQKFTSSSECNTDQSLQLFSRDVSCEEHSKQSKTEEEIIDDVSSSCCDIINEMKKNCNNNTDRKLNANAETADCPEVTNKGNTKKEQINLHENCETKLDFYKKYVNELECRFKGFIQFMINEQQADDKHTMKKMSLAAALKQLKDNESCYKVKMEKLSCELECMRRRSNDRRNRVSSKIERLKRMAKKHAAASAEMVETLSSVAVDLSSPDQKLTAVAAHEDGNENPSEDDEDDDDDVSCVFRKLPACSPNNSRGPVACSTPRRPAQDSADRPCDCSTTTATGATTDNEDYVNDDDLTSRVNIKIPSKKRVDFGSMGQTCVTGIPIGSKVYDYSLTSNGASTSSSVRLPSQAKSSPVRIKSSAGRSTKLTRATSKIDVPIEPTDQCRKSNGTESILCLNRGKFGYLIQNTQMSNGKDSDKLENERSISDEVKEDNQDICVESNEIEAEHNANAIVDSNETIVVQDSDNITIPLRIDDSIILEQTSKKVIREKVWEFLNANSLVLLPKPRFICIPNFKGCTNVTQSLEKLEEFKKAKTVLVTFDEAQETARYITLNWGKRLLVPLPRLKKGLLQNICLPNGEPSINILRSAINRKGLCKRGNNVITLENSDEVNHIDMVILGSVAVDRKGRRIDIGNGFCDLLFAMLCSMNVITDKTVIVTIVHDAQVFNSLPSDIFKRYDVPVDIIITSTEIIRVEERLDRPKNVLWNYVSKRRLMEMPSLQLLRTKQEKDIRLNYTLKEVDSEPEEIFLSPKTHERIKPRSRFTRSSAIHSAIKDTDVSKSRSTPEQLTPGVSLKSNGIAKRSTSTSDQHNRNTPTSKPSNQRNDCEIKSNERRTCKSVTPPVANNTVCTQTDLPSDTSTNIRRSIERRQRHRVVYSANEITIRPRQNCNNYSRDQPLLGGRSNGGRQVQRRDSYRPAPTQQYRYSYDSAPRQSRNFNGPTSHRNSSNGPTLRRNGGINRYNNIRYNSFSNDTMSHQNVYHEVVNNCRGRFSSETTYQERRYTGSRVFQPHYVNGMVCTHFNGYYYESN